MRQHSADGSLQSAAEAQRPPDRDLTRFTVPHKPLQDGISHRERDRLIVPTTAFRLSFLQQICPVQDDGNRRHDVVVRGHVHKEAAIRRDRVLGP
jgi:hypothetical protein